MPAIDSIGLYRTNPTVTGHAATAAAGDSFTLRAFSQPATAKLVGLWRKGAAAGFVGVKSPRLTDDVYGIQVYAAGTPTFDLVGRYATQALYSGDQLTVTISGGSAETDGGVLQVYYSTISGANARLHSWGDVSGMIANILPVKVTNKTAAIGTWHDTVINATRNLLHADTTYAVLGYITGTACIAVGVKGQETGNLRVVGPGSTTTKHTSGYFVELSQELGLPTIPVWRSTNRGAYYSSVIDVAATTTCVVTYIMAELAGTLS